MPYLQEKRATKKVELATAGYWVELYTDGLRYRELKQMTTVDEAGVAKVDLGHATDVSVQALIADWNLDGADGQKLPITLETLDQIPQKDAELILNEIGKVIAPETDDQKKSSSSK